MRPVPASFLRETGLNESDAEKVCIENVLKLLRCRLIRELYDEGIVYFTASNQPRVDSP